MSATDVARRPVPEDYGLLWVRVGRSAVLVDPTREDAVIECDRRDLETLRYNR